MANRTNIENLYTILFLGKSNNELVQNIRPSFHTEIIGSLSLLSISGLDEVSGTFSTMVTLTLFWQDDRLKWDPLEHNNLTYLIVPQSKVWTPSIIIRNSAKKVKTLGLDDNLITIYSDGNVYLNIGDFLETICSFDVTHFPFDRQNCEILFIPWVYFNDSVGLKQKISDVDMSLYSANGMWEILGTQAAVQYVLPGVSRGEVYAELRYTIEMERRYSYFILTIFMPVIMLLLLNSAVFILPADSGERVGYSITCLLALAVFLTLTADVLPKTSDPLSLLSCFLMLLVLTSSVICLMTIITLWLHHKDEKSPMPMFLKKFTYCMLCKGRKTCAKTNEPDKGGDIIVLVSSPKNKVRQEPRGFDANQSKKLETRSGATQKHNRVGSKEEKQALENIDEGEDLFSEITWKKFAELFNFLCLVLTLVFTGLLGFIYVLIARGNL